MTCKKCNSQIPENSVFCPTCGTRVEEATQEVKQTFCSFCGKPFRQDATECEYCGNTKRISKEQKESEEVSGKIIGAYLINFLSAFFTLVIRLAIQVVTKDSSFFSSRYYLEIDPDIKPFLTCIPVIIAVIVAILLATDKQSPKAKKNVAIILNTLMIAISLFIIWVAFPTDYPY
ncbi:MAG: zinc ribbon domain-containing protein [Clostridia bacterium]|nr:zinc ribbon domain-containing protein [Clostridia bacterium]